jgi:hypothetical protein
MDYWRFLIKILTIETQADITPFMLTGSLKIHSQITTLDSQDLTLPLEL